MSTDFSGSKSEEHKHGEEHRKLLALQSAGAVITSSLDLQFVLNTVTKELAGLMGVPTCAISEYYPDPNTINLLAEFGPEGWWDETSEAEVYELDQFPLTKKVLTERRAVQ